MKTKTYWITRKRNQKAKIVRTKNADEFALIKEDGLTQYQIIGNITFIVNLRNTCNDILDDYFKNRRGK